MSTYKLFGTPGNNTLEVVQGTPGEDMLYPMGGWDLVEGYGGTDTVWVQGPAAEFKIVMEADLVYVDTVSGASAYANRVQLKDVERVQFTDRQVDLVAMAPNQVLMDEPGAQDFKGGLGLDTVVFGGPRQDYALQTSGVKRFVTPADPILGRDSLQGIERLRFDDQSLALDVDQGQAGLVAKTLGVVFGPAAVLDRAIVGIGLHVATAFKDQPEGLMRLALEARLGPAPTAANVVDLLYFNLTGLSTPPALRQDFVSMIDAGQVTHEGLALLAADLPLNEANIGWMGLVNNGLPYDPVLA